MKKMITSAFIIALTIGTVQAQKAPARQNGKMEQRMAYDKLDLSADQKTKIKAINEDFRKQMTELKKQDQITVAEMKKRRQSIQENHRSQITALLTPAQKDQLSKMKTERKGKFQQGKGRRDEFVKNRGQWQKELNLTADQQQKVAKIRSESRTKMEALRNDNSISQSQKKEKMHELMKDQQEDIRSVLTKEQTEKMKTLRKDHRSKNTK